jgi:TonB-dependent receptor
MSASMTRSALALRTLFLGSVSLGAAVSAFAQAPATAQQPAATGERTLDEIVVIGSRPIAESEAAELAIQRNSNAIVSVVAADSVGRLPDQNIAFAVGRLAGVAVERDQGQARYVNLRGAPSNWTTLSFDGINIISPEGRRTRFDNVPSALASQLIARKAVTPDMSGETLAGNIDVITRSPFDREGLNVSGKFGFGLVKLGGGEELDLSLVASDQFLDGRLGVLASASYYTRNMITDNFETDWEPVSADAGQPGASDRPLWAREHENKLYRLTRTNISGSLRLGWKQDDNNEYFLNTIYTQYRDDELRSNIKWDLDDRQSSTPTTACSARNAQGTIVSGGNSGYADFCTGNTPFQGTVYGVDFDDNFNDLQSIEYIATHTLGANHLFNGYDIKWRVNYTETDDGSKAPALTDYDSPSTRNLRPTVVYDFRDARIHGVQLFQTIQNPDGSYSRGARITDVEGFQRDLNQLRRRWGGSDSQAVTAVVDVERDIALFGFDTTVKGGLNIAERTKQSSNTTYSASAADITAAGLPRTFAAIAQGRPFLGEIPLGYSFRYHSSQLSRELVSRAMASGRGTYTNSFDYEVTENALAGYLMATTKFDWGNIVYGARVERLENTGRAPTSLRRQVPGSNPATFETVSVITTSESEDTQVFPSAHVNWDINEDMKLRVSFNTGAARADYDQLRPGFTVNDEFETASGGNPNAIPQYATGVDAYFEWYLQPRGVFQLGVFYKDVQDVLFTATTRLGGGVSFPDGIDRSDYLLSGPVNGGEGQITGIEINYQQPFEAYVQALGLPAWAEGFGLRTNATFTDTESLTPGGRKVPLPGASDLVYNVGPYYEKYGVSARLAWQYRTEWLSSISDPGISASNGGDVYWDNDGELDFSIRYSADDRVEYFFDASNLLNGPGVRYATRPEFTIENETFGPRYVGGVRVKF